MKYNKAKTALAMAIFIMAQTLSPFTGLGGANGVKADESVIHISNYEDLKEFAKKCHVDRWSDGKHTFLDEDIEIPEDEELMIASFGGIFDGNGHTISNITLKKAAANSGLFGIILKKGRVSNLHVQGRYKAEGVVKHLGGVCGANYGTVENCTFDGFIKAESEVGGIVGRNMEGGTVISCTVSGKVTGESSCGGIAGYNDGVIRSCSNKAEVDTTYRDKAVTKEEITDAVEELVKGNGGNGLKSLGNRIDIGGIVGLSDGEVYGCTNAGIVGYEHVGFNIGGICGRSTGFIRGCENKGKVYGHKDVGGIAGQQQPYLVMDFEESDIAKINKEVEELGDLINSMLSDVSGYSSETTNQLLQISGLASGAIDDMHKLTDDMGDRTDDMHDTLDDILNQGDTTVEDLHDYLNDILDSVDDLEDNFEDIADEAGLSDSERENVRSSITGIKNNANQFDAIRNRDTGKKDTEKKDEEKKNDKKDNSSVEQLRNAAEETKSQASKILKELEKDVVEEDKEIWTAMQDLKKALDEDVDFKRGDLKPWQIRSYIQKVKKNVATLENKVDKLSAFAGFTAKERSKILENLGELKGELSVLESDSAALSDAESDVAEDVRSRLDDAKSRIEDTKSNVDEAKDRISGNISSGISASADVLARLRRNVADTVQMSSDLVSMLEDDIEDDKDEIFDSVHDLQDTIRGNEHIHNEMTRILDSMDVFSEKTGTLSDTLQADGEMLYGRLAQVIDSINGLALDANSDVQSSIADMKELQRRGDQIRMDVYDVMERASDPDTYTDSRIEDISEQDVEAATDGRTTDSVHKGVVEGDSNIGGITGAMSYEIDLDPEKDYEEKGSATFDFILERSCIVDKCINRGKVRSYRNCGGGIIGKMDLGLVTACRGFGQVKTRDDFCGGICGYSVSIIRSSYAKLTLFGNRYVGGIVGYGKEIRDCVAMVFIKDAEQFVGQIAGSVEEIDIEAVHDNYFYAKDSYGIDDVSFAGIAEGVSFEKLKQLPGVSSDFLTLILTFVKEDDDGDDVILGRIACDYGDSIPSSDIPDVPRKRGFEGTWSKASFDNIRYDEVVKAKYRRYNTLIPSDLWGANDKPRIYAEGKFKREDTLTATRRPGIKTFETGIYSVKLPDDGAKEHVLRYLPSKDDQTVRIFLYGKGGGYVETGTDGKYVTFKAAGNTVEFGAIEYWNKLIISVVAAVVVLAILVITILVVRFKKGKFIVQRISRAIKSRKGQK